MGRGWWSIVDIVGRWLLPLVVVVSGVGVALGAYELSREIEAQRGIDSRTERVTGTVARGTVGLGLYRRQQATVSFSVDGRQITTGVHGLPPGVDSDESVCLEVDSDQPLQARLCGTRGGVDDAWRELLIVGAVLIGSGVLWGLYLWRRRIERRRAEHPLAV
jgi:hypothetical protein